MNKHYCKGTDEILKEFSSNTSGLTNDSVKSLQEKIGFNELKEKKKKSIMEVFLSQFKDLLIFILIGAGIISLLTGNAESTIVIFAVIILNAVLGTVQHFKAEASLESLKALSSPHAKVIRNGEKAQIPSREVVPGDILILEAGDLIVADGRILENYSLQVNESSLTGESLSVNKQSDVIEKDEIPLGDQKNMVFSSSLVTYGRAIVLVTATGMDTEIGKIATLMEETQEKQTPLQRTLDDFSKKLAFIILAICAVVFGLSLYREMPILDSLMFAVALAVAAIPEALSSIVTIVLALGTQKMAKQNAIVKKLNSVESLGCVSIICSDKTGTLTQNKMTVKKVYVDNKIHELDSIDLNKSSHNYLIHNAVLCNDSTSVNGEEIGDPTEVALVNVAHNYGINEIDTRNKIERLKEIPFDSDRKLMSTLHKFDDKIILFTKGATDVLLSRIKYIKTSEGVKEITYKEKEDIIKANSTFSENGLRVLAYCYKELDEVRDLTIDDEYNYTFIGLSAMIDPPRVESAEAVAKCKLAGIKPIMITGDHKITASAIAKEIGILSDGDVAMDGIELDKLSDEELIDVVPHVAVYARVSPEHKIRIVRAWQNRGEIVAMTGDGVNDAPALKQSDIGIAMGITGTEVSKDAASVILTDDNFATIVKSVANGRNIYTNIKNAIRFLLSGNTSGILSVLYTSIMALPTPFAAVHLLFINLLTDSLPAIAIGMEKGTNDVLKEKPRNPKESILTKDFMIGIAYEGIIIAIFTMIAYHLGLKINHGTASTMAFATLCLARLFHGFNCRGKENIFKLGLFTNKYSWMAFIAGLVLLNGVLLIPPFQKLFEITPLSMNNIGMIYLLAFIPTILIQIIKTIYNSISNTKVVSSKSTENTSNENLEKTA